MKRTKEELQARKAAKQEHIALASRAIEAKDFATFKYHVGIAQENGMSKGDAEFWILANLDKFPKIDRYGRDQVARAIRKSLVDFGYANLTIEKVRADVDALVANPNFDFGQEGFDVITGFVKSQLKEANLI